MTAYASLDEFKAWRRSSPSALDGLNVDLDEDDEMLELALESGARRLEAICRRTFVEAGDIPEPRTFTSGHDGRYLFVDDFTELDTIDPITRDGTAIAGVTIATHEQGRPATWLKGRFGWNAEIVVRAKWGWPEIPASVKTANLILAARYFELKGMPLGVLGQPEIGLMTGDAAERAAKELLADYVKLRARFGR